MPRALHKFGFDSNWKRGGEGEAEIEKCCGLDLPSGFTWDQGNLFLTLPPMCTALCPVSFPASSASLSTPLPPSVLWMNKFLSISSAVHMVCPCSGPQKQACNHLVGT